jgi:hypothetical protein
MAEYSLLPVSTDLTQIIHMAGDAELRAHQMILRNRSRVHPVLFQPSNCYIDR